MAFIACRESAGTGQVVLKVVPVAGVLPWHHHRPSNVPLFSHTYYWYEVGMLLYAIDLHSSPCPRVLSAQNPQGFQTRFAFICPPPPPVHKNHLVGARLAKK